MAQSRYSTPHVEQPPPAPPPAWANVAPAAPERRARTPIVAAAICLGLVLGAGAVLLALALGGGGDNDSSSPTTTGAPAITTPTTVTVLSDRARAERMLLTPADAPGFEVEPPDEDDSAPVLGACANGNAVVDRLVGKDPNGARQVLAGAEDTMLSTVVTFGGSVDEARTAMDAIRAPAYGSCVSREVDKAFTLMLTALAPLMTGDDTPVNVQVTMAPLPALPLADESVAHRATIRATAGGRSVLRMYLDFTYIRSGRTVGLFLTSAQNTPFNDSERARLATTLAGRLAAA